MTGEFQLWFWSLVAAAAGLLLCRVKPWLALFVVPFTVVVPFIVVLVPRSPEAAMPAADSLPVILAAAGVLLADVVGLHLGNFKVFWFTLCDGRGEPQSKASKGVRRGPGA